jgi:hypothetical protein
MGELSGPSQHPGIGQLRGRATRPNAFGSLGAFGSVFAQELELIAGGRRRAGLSRLALRTGDHLAAQSRVARQDAEVAEQMEARWGHTSDQASCARHQALNVVDLVLPRLLIGEKIQGDDVAALGLGGFNAL